MTDFLAFQLGYHLADLLTLDSTARPRNENGGITRSQITSKHLATVALEKAVSAKSGANKVGVKVQINLVTF